MVFSSMIFLCVFLPAIFLLHQLLPWIKAKNALLILSSLVFYAYGEPIYVFWLLISSFVNYLLARLTGRSEVHKNVWMVFTVFWNLSFLILLKYAGFLVDIINDLAGTGFPIPEIRMPIGISFFTFQALSYVIDVFRGVAEPQKSFGKVLLYLSFFPQLIAGPIVKYHDVEQEISDRRQSLEEISLGIRRFLAGLCKKVLIANTMGEAADVMFGADMSQINAAGAWIGAMSYMLQIYFDFSGYSDMAIGLGWMFGFHFQENFEYPYISRNIQEFWRRWHISLTSWFREYVYIPLGGNRKGKLRTVLNKMTVFLLTGIWHGASVNFLFWGIYHGFLQMLEEYVPVLRKKAGPVKTVLQHIYVLISVCVGFVFFRADTMVQGFLWIREMFTGFTWNPAAVSLTMQQLTPVYLLTFAAAVFACMPVKQVLKGKRGYEAAACGFSFLGLLLCMMSLAGDTYHPFLYFRF